MHERIELGRFLAGKASVFEAARSKMADRGVVYWNGLTQILEAIEKANSDQARLALADVVIRKYGLIDTVRWELIKMVDNYILVVELEGVQEAIRKAGR